MFPLTALLAILSDVVHALASRTELLYAYQIRNVHFSCIGVQSILRRFKIVEYVRSSTVAYNRDALSLCSLCMSHKSACHIRVFARNDGSTTCSAVSLAFTDTLLISTSPLMIVETRLTPKMSVAVRARDSNPCRYEWRTRHAVTTCPIASECDIARTPLAARFTYISFGYGGCQGLDHMIMSCHLVIQQVQSFGCFDLPFKHDAITI